MESLVAVDGSESSTSALEHATEFATRADAVLRMPTLSNRGFWLK